MFKMICFYIIIIMLLCLYNLLQYRGKVTYTNLSIVKQLCTLVVKVVSQFKHLPSTEHNSSYFVPSLLAVTGSVPNDPVYCRVPQNSQEDTSASITFPSYAT